MAIAHTKRTFPITNTTVVPCLIELPASAGYRGSVSLIFWESAHGGAPECDPPRPIIPDRGVARVYVSDDRISWARPKNGDIFFNGKGVKCSDVGRLDLPPPVVPRAHWDGEFVSYVRVDLEVFDPHYESSCTIVVHHE